MNEACCSRPVASSSYEPVGKYEKLQDGMEVYVTGAADAKCAVVVIYDAFGFGQQQNLGADILAARLNARVFIPDFFRGYVLPRDTFPVDTDATRKLLGEFFGGAGNAPKAAADLGGIVAELKTKAPSATKWASIGFCWGGKVVALSSGAGAPVDVSSACHPGQLNPAEARAFTIPHICLLSGEDGTSDEQKAYKAALEENGKPVHFEIFQDQVHGWMAARADLDDAKVKGEFERGYELVAKFFEKHFG